MSEPKFTPGPWYVIGEKEWIRAAIDDFMICAQVGHEPAESDLFVTNIGPVVAPVFPKAHVGETNLANARLIASAPELYEALYGRDGGGGQLMTSGEVRCPECHHPNPGLAGHLEGCSIKTALAKARGETP